MRKPSLPLTVWRIGDRRFSVFTSYGAMTHGARWNSPGIAVIYASSSITGAMLEVRAHANGIDPPDQSYISIQIPETVSVEVVQRSQVKGWNNASCLASRQFGDLWVDEHRSCVLIVPSVVAPSPAFNIIISTAHPEFKLINHSKPKHLKWDPRLFR
jgi:RES domain-containing protein